MSTTSLVAGLALALALTACGGGGTEEGNPIDAIPAFLFTNTTPWDADVTLQRRRDGGNNNELRFVSVPANSTVEVPEQNAPPGTYTWSARTDTPGSPCGTPGCLLDDDSTVYFIFADRLEPTLVTIDGL